MTSFIYPRVATITRPGAQGGVGFQSSYAADQKATETLVASGVPCSIQAQKRGTKSPVGLPADGNKTTFLIFIPLSAVAKGIIEDRDILTDDEGQRYQITSNYWNSLGYRLSADELEA